MKNWERVIDGCKALEWDYDWRNLCGADAFREIGRASCRERV